MRRRIRKFAENKEQTKNSSNTEATLILCGSSGERANKNSFKVCGHVPGIEVKDILSFKDGKTCSSGRAQLESLWHLDCERIDMNLLCIKDPEDILEVDEFQGDTEDDVFVDSPDPLM